MESKDYDEAKKDLLKAKQLDPEDKLGVTPLLTKVERSLKLEKDKQKAAYSRMFASSKDEDAQ